MPPLLNTAQLSLSFDCIWLQDLKSSALLYAHRCFLRDVALAVPSPTNTIPDLVLPSHIVVPRCAGTEHHRWRQLGNSIYYGRFMPGQSGFLLPAAAHQAGDPPGDGVRQQHALLHGDPAGAPPRPLPLRVQPVQRRLPAQTGN